MDKKCIYCKANINKQSVIDFCEKCGIMVWGDKMFQAIKKNMEEARDTGNLNQGSISDSHLYPSNPRGMHPRKVF